VQEKLLERKLREAVTARGGLAIKLSSMSFTGLPDRLVLMPGGRAYFAEIKTTGKGLLARQLAVAGLLRKLGFHAAVVDCQAALDEFLKVVAG